MYLSKNFTVFVGSHQTYFKFLFRLILKKGCGKLLFKIVVILLIVIAIIIAILLLTVKEIVYDLRIKLFIISKYASTLGVIGLFFWLTSQRVNKIRARIEDDINDNGNRSLKEMKKLYTCQPGDEQHGFWCTPKYDMDKRPYYRHSAWFIHLLAFGYFYKSGAKRYEEEKKENWLCCSSPFCCLQARDSDTSTSLQVQQNVTVNVISCTQIPNLPISIF